MSMPKEYLLPKPASQREDSKRRVGHRPDWQEINSGVRSRPDYDESTELFVTQVLKNWREYHFRKLVNHGLVSGQLSAQVVLSDRAIMQLVKNQRLKRVVTLEGLRVILKSVKVEVESSILRDKDITEMFNMIEAAFDLRNGTGLGCLFSADCYRPYSWRHR